MVIVSVVEEVAPAVSRMVLVKDIDHRVGRLPRRLDDRIGLVDRIGEGAGGIEQEAAMRAGERLAERAGGPAEADGRDGLGFTHVGIGVVGEDFASGGRAAEPLLTPPFSLASAVSGTAVGGVFAVVDTMMLKVSVAERVPR